MSGRNGNNSIRVYYCRNAAGNQVPSELTELQHRPDVQLEAVPCSGRTDPRYLLKAFEAGAAAVCILACPSGDCKTMEGNLRAISRVQAVQELLSEAGLDPESVQIFLPNGSPETGLMAKIESISQMADRVAV